MGSHADTQEVDIDPALQGGTMPESAKAEDQAAIARSEPRGEGPSQDLLSQQQLEPAQILQLLRSLPGVSNSVNLPREEPRANQVVQPSPQAIQPTPTANNGPIGAPQFTAHHAAANDPHLEGLTPAERARRIRLLTNPTEEEWARMKKDNHKEVERRRRGTINEGINELARIVPNTSGGDKAKGAILNRAVQYIHQLKENEARNIEKWTLEKLLMDQAMGDLQREMEEVRRRWEEERARADALQSELDALRQAHGLGLSDDNSNKRQRVE
jgi:bHLH factor